MSRIRIGISSWAEPSLARSGFYPPEVKTPEQRLGYYSSRFSLAEIDSTYHAFPAQKSLGLWLYGTPPGFVWGVRAFSLLTQHPTPAASLPRSIREKYGEQIPAKPRLYLHHLPEAALDELWAGVGRVLAAFQSAGKLGAVLFQFPPWFHPDDRNRAYIASCRERLPDYPLAVEFRVGSWLSEANLPGTLDLLRRLGIALVCVDEPQGLRSSVPPVAEVTAPLAVIRFHGRNAANWERRGITVTERFDYLYGEEELREWLPRIERMASMAREVQLIFKNKHADFPVRNALQMAEMLGVT